VSVSKNELNDSPPGDGEVYDVEKDGFAPGPGFHIIRI